jgi:hypothetical protein
VGIYRLRVLWFLASLLVQVEAKYRGGSKWFQGKVTKENRDGTFNIRYDDGDEEAGIGAAMVRKVSDAGESASKAGPCLLFIFPFSAP